MIPIFPDTRHPAPELDDIGNIRVFVTIGPGETHVSILDGEGCCETSWRAAFGWAALCRIPIPGQGPDDLLTETSLARAVRGTYRRYGAPVDTRAFRAEAERTLRDALDEILSRTVGSGAEYDAVILAGPAWLHPLLGPAIGTRPHILSPVRAI